MNQLPTVLIVEDDVQLAETTCEIVELSGIKAVFRTSIAESMNFLARNVGSVVGVMTDINLTSPMSGIELAVFVAEEWPDVAICVTSGVTADRPSRLPEKAMFLPKPWRIQDIARFADIAARRL